MKRQTNRTRVLCTCIGLIACLVTGMPIAAQHTGNHTLPTDTSACSQPSVSRKLTHQLGIDFRPAYVVPTNDFFDGDNSTGQPIRNVWSVHLKYAFRFNKDSRLGRLYPHAYQGIGVSYNHFDNRPPIGHPVAVYAFQGSRIARLSPTLSLDYEWNFGASFGWEKYHVPEDGSQVLGYNDVVGSKINAYINLGFFLNWQINPQWNLTAGIDLTHYSNGNTHYPNSGVNPVGGRIGLVRTFGAENSSPSANAGQLAPDDFRPHFSYDLVVYGATRKRGYIDDYNMGHLIPGSFGIVGLNFNPMYDFNKYFRAGISLDAQFDESANLQGHYAGGTDDDPKFYRPPFREQFAVGLSARAELVMPIFSVNIGIGHNVLYKGKDTKGFYQILALKTFLTRNLFLHTGYQLSKFKDPNNLMLGLGWRFR